MGFHWKRTVLGRIEAIIVRVQSDQCTGGRLLGVGSRSAEGKAHSGAEAACSFAHVRSKSSSHNAYTRTYTPWITLHGYHKYPCVPVWKVRAVRHSIGRGSQMGSRGDSEFRGRWRGGCRSADWRGRCAAVGGWRLCNVLVVAMTKERSCRHLDR